MTVVVDVGCNFYESHPRDESLERLRQKYRPDAIYGFDPLTEPSHTVRDDCVIVVKDEAAWMFDGELHMGVGAGGLSATCVGAKNGHGEWNEERRVRCFDFPRWLKVAQYGWGGSLIVKLDCEGAEVPLLEGMLKAGADVFVSLLLVEWHGESISAEWRAREDNLIARLRCPVETWT